MPGGCVSPGETRGVETHFPIIAEYGVCSSVHAGQPTKSDPVCSCNDEQTV